MTFYKRALIGKCCTLFICICVQGQRPETGLQAKGQYKKIHRHKIQLLAGGSYDSYIEQLQEIWRDDPKDTETDFGLALANGLKGDDAKATEHVRASLANGLDIRRYFSGPRALSNRLVQSAAFKQLREAKDVQVLHGPMLGNLREDGVDVWIRTKDEVPVTIRVDGKSFAGKTSSKDDYTGVIRLCDLKPDTPYDYTVTIGGKNIPLPFETKFSTLPKNLQQRKFTLAFGGGAGYTPFNERMWDTIGKHHPDILLLLGDNVYIDLPESVASQRYCYYRRQSRMEFRRLIARTPVYSVWDDHDFGTNDCKGGPEIDMPAWKRPVYKIFTENWVNLSYGGGPENPGCWYTARLGPIEFFFLDTRYYRDPGESMLGPVQLEWFINQLKASDATFKVICSSVPMTSGTKPKSKDTWDGFPAEREKIFSVIDRHHISGVFVLAADRHRSDVWKISRPDGYDTYEFMSSRLTNVHVHKVMKEALLSYNQKCSFGLVTFDFSVKDPTVTYKVYSIDNELIYEFQMSLNRLKS